MARRKQATPMKREPSWEHTQVGSTSRWEQRKQDPNSAWDLTANSAVKEDNVASSQTANPPGLIDLVVCVSGIYAAFLSWAVLQERITTTKYGSKHSPEVFRYSVFLNTVQSSFATVIGFIYLKTAATSPATSKLFPTSKIYGPLLLVAITSTLASPFGYASLKHIDYITFILAKSCKLLPVMALHLTIFRKRYPLYKYAVVALVTAGVAIFTLHQPVSSKKASSGPKSNSNWGLLLLSINLLFDGLMNSTQDYIFQTFKPFSGPQMMCSQNLISSILSGVYLISAPVLASTPIGQWLGVSGGELQGALAFIQKYPAVGRDILIFSACGAVGQVFICKGFILSASIQSHIQHILYNFPENQTPNKSGEDSLLWITFVDYFELDVDLRPNSRITPLNKKFNAMQYKVYTLSKFSSLLLVTVTVTRKMLTMIISVLWFGHKLSPMQWLGVGLVFGGVGGEGVIQRREKSKKSANLKAEAEAKDK